MLLEDLELQVEPQGVMDVHTNADNVVEILIQWKDLPKFEATWETFDIINHHFPEFHLEEKLKILGGSVVSRRPITIVYVRHMPKAK